MVAADHVVREEQAVGIVALLEYARAADSLCPRKRAASPARNNRSPTHSSPARKPARGAVPRRPHMRRRPRAPSPNAARGRARRDRAGSSSAPRIASANASTIAGLVAVSAAARANGGRRSGQSLVQVQADLPDRCRFGERCNQPRPSAIPEQGCRQPDRGISVDELRHLARVARPIEVGRRASRPAVPDDSVGDGAQELRVPGLAHRRGNDRHRRQSQWRPCPHRREIIVPDRRRLPAADSLELGANLHHVGRAEDDLLAPVGATIGAAEAIASSISSAKALGSRP